MAFTYFFRDLQPLEAAVDQLVASSMGHKSVRVWDAGCAMGPEPYTIAMLLAERLGEFSYRNLRIFGTDIDGSDLFEKIISDGIYPREQVERIPRDIFEKYFEDVGDDNYRLVHKIRSRVSFQKHDLLSLEPVGHDFNLIVCKNVLLHFSPQQRVEVIRMFHSALADGGLFVTEQTQKMPDELAACFEQVTGNVQLFRKVARP
ncbi:MAG: CheR family methyltransferase [Candidatus Saccharibacteria bacterium]